MTNGYQSFRQAMGTGVDYTFNWFYIDAKDIGYQPSCRCPQRAQGVDPYMPVWGTGQYDWQGFIPFAAEPWDLNPAKGYLTSWNNKQAPGFMANDANYSYGPTYRSEMLDLQVQRKFAQGSRLNRSDVVDIMEEAGTVDLRGQADLSYVLRVLGPAAPAGSDPRLQDMRDRLAAWAALDSHRRDHNHDGQYDDPQSPAIMDAWWPLLTQAIFAPSGDPVGALGIPFDDTNRIITSARRSRTGRTGRCRRTCGRSWAIRSRARFRGHIAAAAACRLAAPRCGHRSGRRRQHCRPSSTRRTSPTGSDRSLMRTSVIRPSA